MKALDYFSDETRMANAIENPDEGIDWILKMNADDWQQLALLWQHRNAAWKEALMYFAGLVSLEDAFQLLMLGLSEPDPNIHVEAALSFADAVLDGDDFPLPPPTLQRLQEIARSPVAQDFDELAVFLKQKP